MRALFGGYGVPLGLALLGAFALILALRSFARFVEWLPLSRAASNRIRLWLPVLATSVVLVYIVGSVQWLMGDGASREWAIFVILAASAAACWRAIRDAMDGLFLRSTGACRSGDYVQLEHLEGRIRRLGWRFLTLETSEGHVATVPYGQIVHTALRRLPEAKHGLLHLFRLEIPPSASLPVIKRRISVAALLCPWCVPKRNARVRSLEQGTQVEVTLSLVDADHAAEAESVVRDAIAALCKQTRPSSSTPGLPRRSATRGSAPPTSRDHSAHEASVAVMNRDKTQKS